MKKKDCCIAGIVIGGLLTLAPAWCLLGTVFGMIRAFIGLGESGISDPAAVASGISSALLSTVIGFVLAPVGLAIAITSIILLARHNRAQCADTTMTTRDFSPANSHPRRWRGWS